MPITYKIDGKRRLVVTTAREALRADDIQQFRAQLLRDPEFDISFSELADLTQVADTNITGDQVRLLALSGPFSQESCRAFLASQEVIYGIARMLEIHCNFRGDERIRVFRERHEAWAWLQKESGFIPWAAP